MWMDRIGYWKDSWFNIIDLYPSPLGHVWLFYRDTEYQFAHWVPLETIGL